MRKYDMNGKHELPWSRGRRGTRLDLTVPQATALLNDPLRCIDDPSKGRLVGVHPDGRLYIFAGNPDPGYHAFPSWGKEICAKFSSSVSNRVAALLGINYKRLSRLEP